MRLINRIRQAQEEYERGEYVIWKPGMFAKPKPKKSVKVRQRALKKIKTNLSIFNTPQTSIFASH